MSEAGTSIVEIKDNLCIDVMQIYEKGKCICKESS